MARYAPKSSWLITLSGFPNVYFTTLSGAQSNRSVITVPDGKGLYPTPIVGSYEPMNIVIGKPYDLDTDPDMVKTLRAWEEGKASYIITATVVDRRRQNAPVGRKIVYSDCKPAGIGLPDIDAGDTTGVAMLQLTFSCRVVN